MDFIKKNVSLLIGIALIIITIISVDLILQKKSQPATIINVTGEYVVTDADHISHYYKSVQAKTKNGEYISLNICRDRISQLPKIGDMISVVNDGFFYKESPKTKIPFFTYMPAFIGSFCCIKKLIF